MFSGILFFLCGGVSGWVIATILGKEEKKRLEAEKGFLQEKNQLLQQFTHEMHDQFKGISSEVLRKNQESFFEMAQLSFERLQLKSQHEWEKREEKVGQLLKPMQTSLEKFDSKLEALEKARIGTESSLKEHLAGVIETQKQLRKETSQLVKALRTPHVRGRWGEVQLRRVVELAGMVEYCDFNQQQSVNSDEGRLRPDLIIKLPGQKEIIVDAKVPLEAYLEAQEVNDDEIRQQKIREHARQVRTHLTALSKKSYWEQFTGSPEFVILFLPGEAFFSAALEGDPSLIEGGAQERVLIATPTTLIALLRAVAYGWRQERLSQQAEKIRDLGKELYKRLSDVVTHWEKLGKNLSSAMEAFNRAVGSWESRFLPAARRFKDLEGLGIEKEIPALDPLELQLRELEREKEIDLEALPLSKESSADET